MKAVAFSWISAVILRCRSCCQGLMSYLSAKSLDEGVLDQRRYYGDDLSLKSYSKNFLLASANSAAMMVIVMTSGGGREFWALVDLLWESRNFRESQLCRDRDQILQKLDQCLSLVSSLFGREYISSQRRHLGKISAGARSVACEAE